MKIINNKKRQKAKKNIRITISRGTAEKKYNR